MIPFNKITKLNGYTLKENWYGSVRIASPLQEREQWHLSWGTADKDRGKECHRCKGRGAVRADERVGCHVCHGLGVVKE